LNGALLTWILEDSSRLFLWADRQIAAEVRGGGEVLHRELLGIKQEGWVERRAAQSDQTDTDEPGFPCLYRIFALCQAVIAAIFALYTSARIRHWF